MRLLLVLTAFCGGLALVQPPAAPPTAPSPRPVAATEVDRLGDPLPAGAVARFGTARFHHENPYAVAYSPDGKTIASGGFGRVVLWEARTGRPITNLVRAPDPVANGAPPGPPVEDGHVFALAFAPDGQTLVAAGTPGDAARGHVLFWDLTGRRCGAAVEHEAKGSGWMRSVTVSPDGRTVATGDDSGGVLLIDAESHRVRTAVQLEPVANQSFPSVECLAFAPDGKTLAAAVADEVRLLDAASGKRAARLPTGAGTRRVAFAPDGTSVWVGRDGGAGAGRPGALARWDLATRTEVRTVEIPREQLWAMAVAPDGKTVVTGGESSGPFVADVATGRGAAIEPREDWSGAWVRGLAFAPDGKTFAATDSRGRVRVWEAATRRELHRHDTHTEGVRRVAVSPDSTRAATCSEDGSVRTWEVATGRPVRTWAADDRRTVSAVQFPPDGRHLLGHRGDEVRRWDADTGAVNGRFAAPGSGRFVLSPDGKLLAAGARAPALYQAATGRLVRQFAGANSATAPEGLAFFPDGRRLASVHAPVEPDRCGPHERVPGGVRVWDAATGGLLLAFEIGSPRGGVAVSPDGRVIAAPSWSAGDRGCHLRFWDAGTGRELVGLRLKGGRAVAFAPDGRSLATGDGGVVRLVEVASGAVVCVFESGAGSVNDLAFTPDGRRLISAHDDGTALVWGLDRRPAAALTPAELWAGLASPDAAAAWRAVGALDADPAGAVALLGERLKPVARAASVRTTAALVTDLDDPDFVVREGASRELARRAPTDIAELTAAAAGSPSPEVRRRATAALRSVPGPWPTRTGDELRQVRAVGVLAALKTPAARKLLRYLAGGDPYAPLTREAKAAGDVE